MFILKLIYALLIFIYISIRIIRDALIISTVGQEGSAIAKCISLIFLIFFGIFQKQLTKKFKIKNIINFSILGFLLIFIGFQFHLYPNNNICISFLPMIVNRLINNTEIILFYIVSEIFAMFIVGNFWLLANTIMKKKDDNRFYSQIFSVAQIGIIASTGFSMIFGKVPIYLIILCFFGILLLLRKIPNEYIEEKEENYEITMNRHILLVPIISALCGFVAGLFDPFVKIQLQKISMNTTDYINKLSTVYLVQSGFSMLISEGLRSTSFFVKKIITPLFLFLFVSFMFLFRPYLSTFSFSVLSSTVLIFFKSLKYSAHSPTKEEYIQKSHYMHSILFFESFASRFGKNISAIVLSLVFATGLRWINIEKDILLVITALSGIWATLSFQMKTKNP